MSSRFTSDEMGHNPQAPGPTKKQEHSCWRKKTLVEFTTLSTNDFIGVTKTWELWRHDRCLFGLQNPWIYPNLVHRQEKILHCLWGRPRVKMRDSLNHIQGNDLGAGWIDHHTDLLLLFSLLYGMVNLSDLPIVERWRSKPCLNLRMVWQFSPCTRQLLPTVGHTVMFKPRPVFCRDPVKLFFDQHEISIVV